MNNLNLLNLTESVLGQGKVTNKGNVAFYCPFCHHHKRKLEVNVNGLIENDEVVHPYHCWICNSSGKKIHTLFKKMGVSTETLRLVEQYEKIYVPREEKDNTTKLKLPDEFKPLYITSDSIEYKNAISYLLKRGVTLLDIIKYNIGYCESGDYSKKIVIPSYDEQGQLNFFVSRAYYDSEFKHKNPDVSKDIVGFELFINWQLPVILVEGVFDALAIKRNVIPLFGKVLPKNLLLKMIEKGCKQVYICLDKDAQKQALSHAELLIRQGIEVFFVDLQSKDPSEIGFESMTSIIKQTKPLDLDQLIWLKMSL